MHNKTCQAYNVAQEYKRWFRMNRKVRKEISFSNLFRKLFNIIFPQITIDQLLISAEQILQKIQLYFTTSVSYHENKKDQVVYQNPGTDYILILSGQFSYKSSMNKQYKWKQMQCIAFDYYLYTKNQKISLRAQEIENVYIKSQKKIIDKLKNDILREDRDAKQKFLSNFLFCNFTPLYTTNHIKIIQVKENHPVELQPGIIYLLYDGLIKRKHKNNKCFDGTELTNGCILSWNVLAHLLQSKYSHQDEQYVAKYHSYLVGFEQQQLNRILKINSSIKKQLLIRLKKIDHERQQLFKRSELVNNINNKQLQHEQTIISYPIQFKNRNIKSSIIQRSFRKKEKTQCQQDFGEFISFNRYDKMLESKQKVALKKQTYFDFQSKIKDRHKPANTADYQKKMKHQNKMMKIKTGKIQKLTLKCGNSDFKTQNLKDIQKKLLNVTNLFDDPFVQIQAPQSKQSSIALSAMQKRRNTKISFLRPEQFLKNEYLQEYLLKSKSRHSLNHQQVSEVLKDNKQNNFAQTACFTRRKNNIKTNCFLLTSVQKGDDKL